MKHSTPPGIISPISLPGVSFSCICPRLIYIQETLKVDSKTRGLLSFSARQVPLLLSIRPDATLQDFSRVCLCSSRKEYLCCSNLLDPLARLSTTRSSPAILALLIPLILLRSSRLAPFQSSLPSLAAAEELQAPPWLRQK